MHALNTRCSLDTCGDWHAAALDWGNLTCRDTDDSVFGDYGLEYDAELEYLEGRFTKANHIRAILDLLEHGEFAPAQGMRDDYICVDTYDGEILEKVTLLKGSAHWPEIDRFMGREYLGKWLDFKEGDTSGRKEGKAFPRD
jgi:hypothetical protein